MATVADFTKLPDATPPVHAYDDPALSPTEFLQAVMHDTTLPIATRIHAASALLPFTDPKPRPTAHISCKIVIEGMSTDNGISQPNSEFGEPNHQPRCGDPHPLNTETTSHPSTFKPFLSTPGISYIEKTLESLPLSEIISIVRDTPEHLLPICTICNFPMLHPCSSVPGDRRYTDPSTLPCVKRHCGARVH
jgi:hypothetical protein